MRNYCYVVTQTRCNNFRINQSGYAAEFYQNTKIIGTARAQLSTNGYLSLFLRFFPSFSFGPILYSLGRTLYPPCSYFGVVGPEGGGPSPLPSFLCYLNDRGSFFRRPLSRSYLQKSRTPFESRGTTHWRDTHANSNRTPWNQSSRWTKSKCKAKKLDIFEIQFLLELYMKWLKWVY